MCVERFFLRRVLSFLNFPPRSSIPHESVFKFLNPLGDVEPFDGVGISRLLRHDFA